MLTCIKIINTHIIIDELFHYLRIKRIEESNIFKNIITLIL